MNDRVNRDLYGFKDVEKAFTAQFTEIGIKWRAVSLCSGLGSMRTMRR